MLEMDLHLKGSEILFAIGGEKTQGYHGSLNPICLVRLQELHQGSDSTRISDVLA